MYYHIFVKFLVSHWSVNTVGEVLLGGVRLCGSVIAKAALKVAE